VNLPGTLQGSVDLRTDVQVVNLSEEGAMVEHAEHVAPGRNCILFLALAGCELRLGSRVVWSQVCRMSHGASGEVGIRFHSGLQFLALPEPTKASLREYLSSLDGAELHPTRRAG
jgi:hypothetical protein